MAATFDQFPATFRFSGALLTSTHHHSLTPSSTRQQSAALTCRACQGLHMLQPALTGGGSLTQGKRILASSYPAASLGNSNFTFTLQYG